MVLSYRKNPDILTSYKSKVSLIIGCFGMYALFPSGRHFV